MSAPAEPEHIDDPSDPRLDPFRSLRAASGVPRQRESALPYVLIEGHTALRNAMRGPLVPHSLLLAPHRLEAVSDIVGDLTTEPELLVAERRLIEEVTGFDAHRGVLASAARPPAKDAVELLSGARRVVVLIGLGDLENTGAVFRVAAALNLDGVLVDHRCADPLYRRCVRVSLGWSTVVPHAWIPEGSDPLELVEAAGFSSVALTPQVDASPVDTAARDGSLADPVALLVGAEGPGLDEAVIASAATSVRIPMAGGVDSLNAATALAVTASFAAAARGWS